MLNINLYALGRPAAPAPCASCNGDVYIDVFDANGARVDVELCPAMCAGARWEKAVFG